MTLTTYCQVALLSISGFLRNSIYCEIYLDNTVEGTREVYFLHKYAENQYLK